MEVAGRNQPMEAETSTFKFLFHFCNWNICGNFSGILLGVIALGDSVAFLKTESSRLRPCADFSALLGGCRECVCVYPRLTFSKHGFIEHEATGSFLSALLIKRFIKHSGETPPLFGFGWIDRARSERLRLPTHTHPPHPLGSLLVGRRKECF